MKRLVTLTTILLVCLGSAQLAQAQSDDQSNKKKKKKAQTTQTTSTQTSGGTRTGNKPSKTQISNQQATKASSRKVHSNTQTTGNYNRNTENLRVGKSKNQTKNKKQTNVVTNNNARVKNQRSVVTNNNVKVKNQRSVVTNNNVNVNKKAYRQFKRSGNEWSYNVARTRYVRVQHDRNWWNHHYNRIVLYGGGYWYWNAGWWYPAWGYNPYYNNYVYDGPILGYGYAAPGDVTADVQRALAARGYYYGPIDGILGPGTRSAIERYQINRGLAVTAAIDEPTLATLGLA